jgi:hypothetical protein
MAINPLQNVSSLVQDITGVTAGGVTNVTAAAPITSTGTNTPQIGLTTPLAVVYGGTGVATLANFVTADGTTPLTGPWNAGNQLVNSQNSTRWFNIIAYGADPTGAADSTAAINNTIAAALALGGNVEAPQGHYKITSTIVLGAFATATRGLTIRGEGGGYAPGGSWVGTSFVWAGGATPMFWVKNFQDLVIDGVCLDGANVATSTAILFDNDGTAAANTSRNAMRNVLIRRFHDGICVGTLTASAGTPNLNQIDTLTLDKVSFSESITGSEGAAIFLNCGSFTGSHFSNVYIFQWRYGVWVNGSATVSGGGFTMSDSTAGANGAITMDMVYCDHIHSLITLDNCEGESLGAAGHYFYVTAGAVANLYWPITIRNSNTTTMLFAQQSQVLTEGCNHPGVITFSGGASKWTSISDSFNGGAPVIGGGTVFTRQDGAGLGTPAASFVPPTGFQAVGSGTTTNATTTYVDVPSTSTTFPPSMNCLASFDSAQTTAGSDLFVGTLNVNTVAQTISANGLNASINGERQSQSQGWLISLTGGVSYTFKLQFKSAFAAVTFTVYGTNTTMNVILLGKF